MQNQTLQSFIEYDENNSFPLENIPFGCYEFSEGVNHCCTRIGQYVVDLAVLFKFFDGPLFSQLKDNVFQKENLNDFAKLGKDYRIEARQTIQKLFSVQNKGLIDDKTLQESLKEYQNVKMVLPVFIRDYTDFYSSKNHAYNVGVMIRGPENALQPNYFHLPVGYHGRASSIVVDGTNVIRPKGQVSNDNLKPEWTECKRLDFELEMGTIISVANKLGQPIKVENARDHIFGYCLLNDWSARDIQKWEYVPLGPFLAKNFCSTISPWVITPEALEPFRVGLPQQDPSLLPYLQDKNLEAYDINLKVHIRTEKMGEQWHKISESNMKHLYYSVPQTIAHHTVTGCNLNTGDLLGSGTISSPDKSGYGSLIELCWGGKETINLPSGEERKFLVNGDEINLTGECKGNGFKIGFGDCRGKILPSLDDSNYF